MVLPVLVPAPAYTVLLCISERGSVGGKPASGCKAVNSFRDLVVSPGMKPVLEVDGGSHATSAGFVGHELRLDGAGFGTSHVPPRVSPPIVESGDHETVPVSHQLDVNRHDVASGMSCWPSAVVVGDLPDPGPSTGGRGGPTIHGGANAEHAAECIKVPLQGSNVASRQCFEDGWRAGQRSGLGASSLCEAEECVIRQASEAACVCPAASLSSWYRCPIQAACLNSESPSNTTGSESYGSAAQHPAVKCLS